MNLEMPKTVKEIKDLIEALEHHIDENALFLKGYIEALRWVVKE